MQKEILEKQPDADVRVYAVWFSMLESDSKPSWPREALTDPRVTHLWDEGRVLGRWYAQDLKLKLWSMTLQTWTDALWDAYLLYGPEARWTSGPRPLVGWGTTIMESRDELRTNLESLLRKSTKKDSKRRGDGASSSHRERKAKRQLDACLDESECRGSCCRSD